MNILEIICQVLNKKFEYFVYIQNNYEEVFDSFMKLSSDYIINNKENSKNIDFFSCLISNGFNNSDQWLENLLSKYNVKYSFIDFIKYGTIISIPTLLIALSTLLITI